MTAYTVRKGNRAESAVRFALERQGYLVRDGPHNEGGCDLYVFHRDRTLAFEIEVKGRKDTTANGLLPRDKRSLVRRARACEKIGFPYRLYFVRFEGAKLPSHAQIFRVGELHASANRKGLHLDLYEEGLLTLSPSEGRPPMVVNDAPLQVADGEAE